MTDLYSVPMSAADSHSNPRAEIQCVLVAWHHEDGADIIRENCQIADFTVGVARTLFSMVCELRDRNEAVDMATVGEIMRVRDQQEVLAPIVTHVACGTWSPLANGEAYSKIVGRLGTTRRVIEALSESMHFARGFNGLEVADLTGFVEERIYDATITHQKSTALTMRELVALTIDNIAEAKKTGQVPGIKTGFRDLDAMNARPRAGTITTVAGRPGMGKTSFIRELVLRVARAGGVVLVMSLEVPNGMFGLQYACQLTGIPFERLEAGRVKDSEIADVIEALSAIAELPIVFDDKSGATPAMIAARARRVARQYGGKIDMVVVDYLQLVNTDEKTNGEYEGTTSAGKGLKAKAKDLGAAFVVLSQLNRKVTERADQHPRASDLRGSGQIEEMSDIILGFHRPIVPWALGQKGGDEGAKPWGQAMQEDREAPDPLLCDVDVLKNKYGETGRVRLKFTAERTEFDDWDDGGGWNG